MRVYAPEGAIGLAPARRAASPASLAGLRIAVVDNGKPNAMLVMTRLAESLAARTGAKLALKTKKGPNGESANAAIPAAADTIARVVAQADVVITGSAD
jgi:hypothetical protein